MVVSTGERRRKTDGREYDTSPPIPCILKELDTARQVDSRWSFQA